METKPQTTHYLTGEVIRQIDLLPKIKKHFDIDSLTQFKSILEKIDDLVGQLEAVGGQKCVWNFMCYCRLDKLKKSLHPGIRKDYEKILLKDTDGKTAVTDEMWTAIKEAVGRRLTILENRPNLHPKSAKKTEDTLQSKKVAVVRPTPKHAPKCVLCDVAGHSIFSEKCPAMRVKGYQLLKAIMGHSLCVRCLHTIDECKQSKVECGRARVKKSGHTFSVECPAGCRLGQVPLNKKVCGCTRSASNGHLEEVETDLVIAMAAHSIES